MSLSYAAPEQQQGGELGPKTDLYSAAKVIDELIAGSAAPLQASERTRPTPVILRDCLKEDPKERPASAERVFKPLQHLREQYPARLDAKALVLLLLERVSPPDLYAPLHEDWRALERQLRLTPLPIPDEWMSGNPLSLQVAPPARSGRRAEDGVAWPIGQEHLSGRASSLPVPPLPRPSPWPTIESAAESSTAHYGGEPEQSGGPPVEPSGFAERSLPGWYPGVLGAAAWAMFGALVISGGSWLAMNIEWPPPPPPPVIEVKPDLPPSSSAPVAPTQPPVVEPPPRQPSPVCKDQDGDEHQSCTPPGERDDCDDADPKVYPGAVEKCDGIDNDCDETTFASGEQRDAQGKIRCEKKLPKADPAPAPGPPKKYSCYVDRDEDGFGALSSSDTPCNADSLSERPIDCNDDPTMGRSIYPGADEDCSDKVDSDCSGPEGDVCKHYTNHAITLDKERLSVKFDVNKERIRCDGSVSWVVQFPGEAPKTFALSSDGRGTWMGEVELNKKQAKSNGDISYHYSCQTAKGVTPLYYKDGGYRRSMPLPNNTQP